LKGTRGRNALLVVVAVTALVLTPLVLLGVYLGYYVGDQVGYSKGAFAIAFSTVGFLAGITMVFRVIKSVAKWAGRSS